MEVCNLENELRSYIKIIILNNRHEKQDVVKIEEGRISKLLRERNKKK